MISTSKLLRAALGLSAICALSAGVASSGAFLVSKDTSAGSSVSSARVELHVLRAGRPATGTILLDGADLRPGEADARTSIVELRNAGDRPAALALDFAGAPTGAGLQLLQALKLIVDDCGADDLCASPTQVFSGSLPDASDVDFPPALDPGTSRFVRLRLHWPQDDDDPSLYGVSTTFRFHWSATSL